MQIHVEKFHHKCEKCGEILATRRTFLTHMWTNHKVATTENKEEMKRLGKVGADVDAAELLELIAQ